MGDLRNGEMLIIWLLGDLVSRFVVHFPFTYHQWRNLQIFEILSHSWLKEQFEKGFLEF